MKQRKVVHVVQPGDRYQLVVDGSPKGVVYRSEDQVNAYYRQLNGTIGQTSHVAIYRNGSFYYTVR